MSAGQALFLQRHHLRSHVNVGNYERVVTATLRDLLSNHAVRGLLNATLCESSADGGGAEYTLIWIFDSPLSAEEAWEVLDGDGDTPAPLEWAAFTASVDQFVASVEDRTEFTIVARVAADEEEDKAKKKKKKKKKKKEEASPKHTRRTSMPSIFSLSGRSGRGAGSPVGSPLGLKSALASMPAHRRRNSHDSSSSSSSARRRRDAEKMKSWKMEHEGRRIGAPPSAMRRNSKTEIPAARTPLRRSRTVHFGEKTTVFEFTALDAIPEEREREQNRDDASSSSSSSDSDSDAGHGGRDSAAARREQEDVGAALVRARLNLLREKSRDETRRTNSLTGLHKQNVRKAWKGKSGRIGPRRMRKVLGND